MVNYARDLSLDHTLASDQGDEIDHSTIPLLVTKEMRSINAFLLLTPITQQGKIDILFQQLPDL